MHLQNGAITALIVAALHGLVLCTCWVPAHWASHAGTFALLLTPYPDPFAWHSVRLPAAATWRRCTS